MRDDPESASLTPKFQHNFGRPSEEDTDAWVGFERRRADVRWLPDDLREAAREDLRTKANGGHSSRSYTRAARLVNAPAGRAQCLAQTARQGTERLHGARLDRVVKDANGEYLYDRHASNPRVMEQLTAKGRELIAPLVGGRRIDARSKKQV